MMTMIHGDNNPSPSGLLLFRTLYFLDGLGGAAWGRFGVVYYNQVKHLTSEQIGWLQGIRPIIGFLARPSWGWIADHLQSRKRIFMVCKVGSTLSLLTLAAYADTFESVALAVSAMSLFPTVGILDAHAIDFLGDKHRDMYGSVRLWATISWGLGSILMGFLTDHFGSFVWNFVVFGIMMLASLLFTIIFLPARSKSEQERYDSPNSDNKPQWKMLVHGLAKWQIFVWLLHVTLFGAATSLVDSFLFVYLQNDLKASTQLCGYTVGVTVLLEIPVFAHSKYLLAKLRHDGLFLVAMFAYAIRVFGYTILTPGTVHYIFLLEFLHGITLSTAWIAAVDFCAKVGPKAWTTLVQSLLGAFWGCLGGSVGPVLGGWVYQRYGAIVMFRSAGLIMAIVMVIHALLWLSGLFTYHGFLRQVERAVKNDSLLPLVQSSSGNDDSSPVKPYDPTTSKLQQRRTRPIQ